MLRTEGFKIALLAVMSAALHAQTPKFEVASIKACKNDADAGRGTKGGSGGGGIRWDPGRIHEECQTVSNLIRDAYLAYPEGKPWLGNTREGPSPEGRGMTSRGCFGCGRGVPPVSDRLLSAPIEGAPAWMTAARYTIDAKAEGTATPERMRGPMMRALLEDRFQLKIRREPRERPVYELTVAPGGPKLKPSREGSCEFWDPGKPRALGKLCGAVRSVDGRTEIFGTTLLGVCRQLSIFFDRDVVDKTGITGFYDFEMDADIMRLSPEEPAVPRDDGIPPPPPPLDRVATFKAFQRAMPKLGLKLDPAKGSDMFLVIDHIERPTEN